MDIVVTIPKSEYENDDRETAVYEQGGYEQFWQLRNRPKQLLVNDRVFFVKHNLVESSMRVVRIEVEASATCEVTNREWSGCLIYLDDLCKEKGPRVRGFQNFRYRWWL